MAFVVQDCSRSSGQGHYTLELGSRLSRRGIEVTLFTARADDDLPEGLRVRRCPIAPRSHLLASQALMLWARRHTRAGGFDLVHGAGANALHMDVATLHCCHRAWARACPPGTLRRRLEANLYQGLERLLLSPGRLQRLIAISERVRQEAAEFLGFPAERIDCIPHGVDSSRFAPAPSGSHRAELRQELGLPEDAFLLMTVGLGLHKGLPRLVEALSRLPPRVRLLAMGEGDPAPIRAQAQALGVADRLLFAGPVKDPQRIYKAADALGILSGYDAFGMAVLEGMASGLPVLVSRAAGASELAIHDVDALVIEDPARPEESVHWIQALLKDPALGRRLGIAARETALRHSWDRVAEKTLRVYETLWKASA